MRSAVVVEAGSVVVEDDYEGRGTLFNNESFFIYLGRFLCY